MIKIFIANTLFSTLQRLWQVMHKIVAETAGVKSKAFMQYYNSAAPPYEAMNVKDKLSNEMRNVCGIFKHFDVKILTGHDFMI